MENTSKSNSPKYLKLERSWYRSARSTLPRAQADKVLGAIIAYFFDLEEPKLPKDAQILFEALRAQIDFKRSQSLILPHSNPYGRSRLQRQSTASSDGI